MWLLDGADASRGKVRVEPGAGQRGRVSQGGQSAWRWVREQDMAMWRHAAEQ